MKIDLVLTIANRKCEPPSVNETKPALFVSRHNDRVVVGPRAGKFATIAASHGQKALAHHHVSARCNRKWSIERD
jgi:hypothetical protein